MVSSTTWRPIENTTEGRQDLWPEISEFKVNLAAVHG